VPIKPENLARYPKDWKQIRSRILERAQNRCEQCGVENGAPLKRWKVVLTIAHLDHVPEHCADENLKALCQRCHLAYDQQHHQRNAWLMRRAAKRTDELPLDIDSP